MPLRASFGEDQRRYRAFQCTGGRAAAQARAQAPGEPLPKPRLRRYDAARGLLAAKPPMNAGRNKGILRHPKQSHPPVALPEPERKRASARERAVSLTTAPLRSRHRCRPAGRHEFGGVVGASVFPHRHRANPHESTPVFTASSACIGVHRRLFMRHWAFHPPSTESS